jgi:DNA-binding MarR family transcriptional regulator
MRPTETLDRVLALAVMVTADMTRFEQQHGMTTARVHVLWHLGASGPCTQRALADALAVTPRNVTGLVDGLEASGHVSREAHPTDRRAILVTLTARGRAMVEELRAGHVALAEDLFGDMGEAELIRYTGWLDDTLSRFARLVEVDR